MFWELLIAIVTSSGMAAVISGLFSVAKSNRKSENAIKKGVQQLLFGQIKKTCKESIKSGYIKFEDLQDLERMHKIYHDDLGGNGYLDDLMSNVRDLLIVENHIQK